MKKNLLIIDLSVVAHEAWSTVEKSTPSYEQKVYRAALFKRIYGYILSIAPTQTIIAMDSRGGYWRHMQFEQEYRKKLEWCVDESGLFWVRYGGNSFRIDPVGLEEYIKVKAKKDDPVPTEGWYPFVDFKPWLDAWFTADEQKPYLEMMKEGFPRYKGHRRHKAWNMATPLTRWHEYTDELAMDMAQTLGIRAVRCALAEADDIAGWCSRKLGSNWVLTLLTTDSDWDQLQSNGNVIRFDPLKQEYVEADDPLTALHIKILSGDSGDGIPSCKYPNGKSIGKVEAKKILSSCQQDFNKVIEKAKEEGWGDALDFNIKMIDLKSTPQAIQDGISSAMKIPLPKPLGNIYEYGIAKDELMALKMSTQVKAWSKAVEA